ncbi:MAG: hypothetical protein ABIR16_05195, partial [Dokdonella sp.]
MATTESLSYNKVMARVGPRIFSVGQPNGRVEIAARPPFRTHHENHPPNIPAIIAFTCNFGIGNS